MNLAVSVAYDTDLNQAMPVINRVGKELAEDPKWKPCIIVAPQALRVEELGDSGVSIGIGGETKAMRQRDVMGELRKTIKEAFEAEGIEIPFPASRILVDTVYPSVNDMRMPKTGSDVGGLGDVMRDSSSR